ncbi:MAG: 9-O-acetylesterase [Planctomycetes bacterium]|nr:9-O-acetylesterase [Planctomycetota bacterium]
MRFAPLFHDHAVLQRDQPMPIWGSASPGETVEVTLAGLTASVIAGDTGAWLVRLPGLPAGGPHELVATARSGRAVARDLLIGEVWVCSGQSNMEWQLKDTEQGDLGDEDVARIRLLTITTPARLGRTSAIGGSWVVANSTTLATFSAVGGWFGRALHRELGVPVGLICNAWGGTRIQAWTSRQSLVQDPSGLDDVRHFEGYVFARERAEAGTFTSFEDWEQRGAPRDTGNAGLAKGWAGVGFADQAWRQMPLPAHWQQHGHPGSGIFWFRRTVTVPKNWAGRACVLHLGAIDKHDDTYVNGERVGGLTWSDGPETWRTARSYQLPGQLVRADGTVSIAVRARSHVFSGGMTGPATAMRLEIADGSMAAVPLAGDWRYEIEQDWGMSAPPQMQWGADNPNSPYILFDSRIEPLLPYGIRGTIWYQGESNADEPALYARLMPGMIRDWRRAWGQGDFPFLQVQLANFMPAHAQPVRSDWAALREAQLHALAEPATGLAVAIDVGDADDIHPRDKRTVGQRLARWALSTTYGRGGAASGPLFAAATIESAGRMRCRFRHGDGLRTRDGGVPRHVAIAGNDRRFIWAEAAIEGDTLVAWHPTIHRPAAVRYAWADNPDTCNLVNGDGLPASPFRTDSW